MFTSANVQFAEVISNNCKPIDMSNAQVIAVSKLPAMAAATEFCRLLRRAEACITASDTTTLAAKMEGTAPDGALKYSERDVDLVTRYAQSTLSQQGRRRGFHLIFFLAPSFPNLRICISTSTRPGDVSTWPGPLRRKP